MRRSVLLAASVLFAAIRLSAQQSIVVSSPDGQPVSVTYQAPPTTCTPASGSLFPVGSTTVACAGSLTVTVSLPGLFDYQRETLPWQVARGPSGFTFAFNQDAIGYNPATNTLYLACNANGALTPPTIAEIALPTPAPAGTPIASVPRSALLQPCADPTEGTWKIVGAESPGTPIRVGGLRPLGDRLYGTLYAYYDNSVQRSSVWSRPLSLAASGQVTGPLALTATPPIADGGKTFSAGRFANGYLPKIPPEYQAAFGGSLLVGGTPANISASASNGPSGFGWTPGSPTAASALWYSVFHPLSAGWNQQSDQWNGTVGVSHAVIVGRSLLQLINIGVGDDLQPYCYGPAVTYRPPPAGYCYDPYDQNKGGHAPPYVVRLLGFDLLDLIKVRQGTLQPYAVRPYASWTLAMPYPSSKRIHVNGFDYDDVNRRLILTQYRADGDAPLIYFIPLR